MSTGAADHPVPGPRTVSPGTSGGPRGLRRNVVVTVAGNSAPPLAALATAPILAHALGVDGRGQVAAGVAPLMLFSALASLGLPEAVTYEVARHGRVGVTRRAVALTALAGAAALGLIGWATPWLSTGDPGLATLIWMASAALLPALVLGVVRGHAAGRHRWPLIAGERVLASAVRAGGIAGLAVGGALTPTSATAVLALAPLVGGTVYLRLLTTRRAPRVLIGDATDDRSPTRRLLGYGGRVWIGSLAGVLIMRLDQFLLAPLSAVYELGLYAVAVAVSEIPLVVTGAVRDVLFAAESAHRDDARLARVARTTGVVTLSAGLMTAALTPVGLPLLFGQDFEGAVGVTLVLLLGSVVGTAGSIAGAGLAGRGRPGLRSTSLAAAASVNLLLLVALAPVLGALGAAWATVAGNVVSSGMNLLFMRSRFGTPIKSYIGIRRGDLAVLLRMGVEVRKVGRR